MASRGFTRPAVFWDSSGVDISAMYANGFEPHIVFNPSYNNVYKEVGSSNTNVLPALGESQGTFTRGSTGTYVDDDGNYASVSAHEPRTFNGRLLMEPQRTNELVYSEDLTNAAWNLFETTITADDIAAPDGTNTADKLVESSNSGDHGVWQKPSGFSDGETGTISVFAADAERQWVKLEVLVDNGSGTTEFGGAWFDVKNGTVGTVESPTNATIEDTGIEGPSSGFYRPYVVVTPNAGFKVNQGKYFVCNGDGVTSYAGDGTSGLHLWGMQFESGAFPTTYIPTSGSTVTRSQDQPDPLSDYTKSYDASEGATLYWKGDLLGGEGNLPASKSILEIQDSDDSDHLIIGTDSSGNLFAESKTAGTAESDALSTGASRGDTVEIALREQSSGYAVQYTVNGGSVTDVTLSSLSTNHADGLTWSKSLMGGAGVETAASAVMRGDITLAQCRTVTNNRQN